MKAVVVAGGRIGDHDFYRNLISDCDLIIGADSGADSIRELGLVPHIAVGDFDSVSADTLDWLKAGNVVIREFPADKDKTDLELAVDEAVARGAAEIVLTGTWGGRLDQTLANVFLLASARKQGITCYIREESGDIYLVDRALAIEGAADDIVSLIALEDSVGVKLTGFKYQVPEGRLALGSTLGISNILLGEQGTIELQSGLLLVIRIPGGVASGGRPGSR